MKTLLIAAAFLVSMGVVNQADAACRRGPARRVMSAASKIRPMRAVTRLGVKVARLRPRANFKKRQECTAAAWGKRDSR